jgi:starch phosphorylase
MINGALTMGTFDGANVEISQVVGEDNIYIFGMRNDEVDDVWKHGYNSYDYYNRSEPLKRVINRLGIGFNGVSFRDMVNYLLLSHGIADPYMCLADFDSYCAAHNRLNADYQNKELWAKKSLINIAEAGFFAADRSIEEYAQRIWHLTKVK